MQAAFMLLSKAYITNLITDSEDIFLEIVNR